MKLTEKYNCKIKESREEDLADEINNALSSAYADLSSFEKKHKKLLSSDGIKKLKKYQAQVSDLMNDVNDLWQDEGVTKDFR